MSKILVDSNVFINAFKADSEFRDDSLRFLNYLRNHNLGITMPAHGWFEILCSLRRIERKEKVFDGPLIAGVRDYPIELIHIDNHFISKYGNVDIPYVKAGDHIFVVVAHANGYKLVTWDKGMTKVAQQLSVNVCNPLEFLNESNPSS